MDNSILTKHPFAGRKGASLRDSHAARLYAEQAGKCAMCQRAIDPTLRGKSAINSAVIDHIRPWMLRPDLAKAAHNLWLICQSCHATCDSIEKTNWPDADLIAEIKRRSGEAW